MKTNRVKSNEKKGIATDASANAISYADVQRRIICVREMPVILDADVAELYGVETKRVNAAVRNNLAKVPPDYMFELTKVETSDLRSNFSSAKLSSKSRVSPKAFTEKGLYMLATILKSPQATAATFAIIETFAKVRVLKRELLELHGDTDQTSQTDKLHHFGQTLADIVMPDLDTVETESSLELNFLVGKLKHTVRRVKKAAP